MSAPDIKVLLTGPMGSGTSTAADHLEAKGFTRWSRTELMVRLAYAIGPQQNGNPDELLGRIFDDEHERDEVRLQLLRYAARYEPEAGKPRRLIQDVTAICQAHDPLCFEVELDERMRAAGVGPHTLIDDVRSRDALEFYAAHGFTTVRLHAPRDICERRLLAKEGALPPAEVLNHASETELDDVIHDVVIDNSVDGLRHLYAQLDELIARGRA